MSAMGSAPESPVKVTDLLLNMIAKAARQDAAFLVDLAALQVCVLRSVRSVGRCWRESVEHKQLWLGVVWCFAW